MEEQADVSASVEQSEETKAMALEAETLTHQARVALLKAIIHTASLAGSENFTSPDGAMLLQSAARSYDLVMARR